MNSEHRTRVLVVDDETSMCLMVRSFLQRSGYDCLCTDDPNNALAMLEKDSFGLVISDISMPEVSGVELLREITHRHPGVDTILMTGYKGEYNYSDIIEAGAADFIEKPLVLAELKTRVERVVRERRTLEEIREANTALKATLDRMNAITEYAQDAIVTMGPDGAITFWNPAAESILGYSKEEVIGKNLHSLLVPPRYQALHQEAFPEFLETGLGNAVGKTLELSALRKDGEEIAVELSLSTFFDDGWQAMGLLRDITERKKEEERSRQQNERLGKAYDEIELLYQHLQREYDLAADVLSRVATSNYSRFPNIRHVSLPLDTVGGDLLMVERKPSGGINVMLGDFTGHGLSSTIGLVPVAKIFQAMTSKNCSISEIISECNTVLKSILPTGLYLCACFVELNSTHDSITVWNGGMPDVLLVGPRGEIKQRFLSNSLPLGIVDTDRLDVNGQDVSVEDGDALYAYSDGLIEVQNANGDAYGQEGLERSFQHRGDEISLFDRIMNDFGVFNSGSRRLDDVLLAEIKFGPRYVLPASPSHGFRPKSPAWKMSVQLGPDNFRSDPIEFLMTMLLEVWELRGHKENIYLILAELLSNALDYGVLRVDPALRATPEGFGKYFALRQDALETLESGWVKVDVELALHAGEPMLLIRVEDSGPGFDPSMLDSCALAGNLTSCGRGVQLTQALCKSLNYNNKGNCAEARYAL